MRTVDPLRLREAFERACDLRGREREALLAELREVDGALAAAVAELLERDARTRGPLQREDSTPPSSLPATEFVRGLSRHRPAQSRYRLVGELARGGMGAVLRVWDEALDRALAMKVVLGTESGSGGGGTVATPGDDPLRSEQVLARFLEEAQVTGRLDHPGIVPVHELGLDHDGRVYFTMRLVEGRELREVLDLARTGAEGWSRERVLEVLIKVCDALAFAHSRGVVHRDLKPSNVMVGRFGEVYVMDWGLARVLDRESRGGEGPDAVHARWEPAGGRGDGDDSSSGSGTRLPTEEGAVMGTPAYMPPEQARGERDRIGPAADVYALGAMLYHLLAGRVPYRAGSGKQDAYAVVDQLLDGPPTPLAEAAPGAPPELVAICERAMAREPEDRFESASALAEDLRNFLELRVVRSYATGWRPELVKWVRRNRPAAVALVALLVVVVAAALGGVWLQGEREAASRESEALLVSLGLTAPLARMDELRLRPDTVPEIEDWIAEVEELLSRRGETEARWSDLLARGEGVGLPDDLADELTVRRRLFETNAGALLRALAHLARPHATAARRAESCWDLQALAWAVPRREARMLEDEALAAWSRTARFDDSADAAELARLGVALADYDRLGHPEFGALTRVRDWLEQARGLERRSLVVEALAWEDARARIAEHPLYGGLDLRPQLGLVPLGPDPDSGLWEFWHVLSGERPGRRADGRLACGPDSGLVFALVPGGTTTLGAGDDRRAPERERRRLELRVDPFFLAKHELTQAQWYRATRELPARIPAGYDYRGEWRVTPRNPVEQVTWYEARAVLRRWDLGFPSEGQWEHAARAGGDGYYGEVDEFDPLAARVQHNDLYEDAAGRVRSGLDAYIHHAPVDLTHANPWGLHGMLGNVSEWMEHPYYEDLGAIEIDPGVGRFTCDAEPQGRATRGGSYLDKRDDCGVTARYYLEPTRAALSTGVRPARPVRP